MRTQIILAMCTVLHGAASAEQSKPQSMIDEKGMTLPITVSYLMKKGANLSKEEWPFASDEIMFFCAKRIVFGYSQAFDVYGFDGKFGALNGTTSTFAQKGLMVVDASGASRPIVSISDNQLHKDAGLALQSASNPAFGDWTDQMNKKLLESCS